MIIDPNEPQVMIDLETMGLKNNAAIVAIGAVRFTISEGITDLFYKRISLTSSVHAGTSMDPQTVLWWMKQDGEARREIHEGKADLRETLEALHSRLYHYGSYPTWGNGATFDNIILRNSYEAVGIPCPWTYMHDRCYRTLWNLFPNIPYEFRGTKHNALDDARSQALHLLKIFESIGGE